MSDYISHPYIKPETIEKRLYQETIIASASGKNTLVVLPTGIGKTIIALGAAAHRLDKFPGKKIMLLAPTKPLVLQHKKTFENMFNLKKIDALEVFTGQNAPETREKLWKKVQMVFATPQVVQNDLIAGTMKLDDFSLIIFDEAHRAFGDYAYTFIAEQYMKQAENPLILGLTASPGAQEEKIGAICANLFTKNVEIRTETDNDVREYVKPTRINWVKVELDSDFIKIRDNLQKALDKKTRYLIKFGYLKKSRVGKGVLLELQRSVAAIAMRERKPLQFQAMSNVAVCIKLTHALELLQTQGIHQLREYFLKMQNEQKSKAVKSIMNDENVKNAISMTDWMYEHKREHPKLPRLKAILLDSLKNGKKAIVFTQYVSTVNQIHECLEKTKLKPVKFIGQRRGHTQKKQMETLDNFREGAYNCLISTSVHPDEYIVVRTPLNKIRIVKIGEFVEKFLDKNALSKNIKGWKALSGNAKKVDFYPITHVHKHKRQSNVVRVKLNNGFESLITEDHSIFTFNKHGKSIPGKPKQNLFTNIAFSARNVEDIKEIDVVKELLANAPSSVLKRMYCAFEGLNQPMMRILSFDYKTLKALTRASKYKTQISKSSGLNISTITDVTKRLEKEKYLVSHRTGKSITCRLTKKGKEYLDFLDWFFEKHYYWKRKYRMKLDDVASAPYHVRKFCDMHVAVLYGKTKIPRFLEINDHLAAFLGFYVSEGSARKTRMTSGVLLSARNKKMQNKMKKSVEKGLFIRPSVNWKGVYVDSQLAYHLVKYVFGCGIGSINKEIPSVIFSSPAQQKWKFLEAYFLGDGYHGNERIVLTTISRKLVVGLSLLTRQLGIKKITIREEKRNKKNHHNCYRLSINESLPFARLKPKTGKNAYYDTMPSALLSKKSFAKFGNRYAPVNSREKSRIMKKPKEKTCFDYIKKIEILKNQPKFVYDISVKNTERFFGGPGLICLHNSVAEEGLDIPKVDCVIFYEPIASEIRNIQRRGRTGRLNAGEVFILMTKGTIDEAYYWSSRRKEKKMTSILQTMHHSMREGGIEVSSEEAISIKDKQTGQISLDDYKRDSRTVIFSDCRENALLKELVKRDIALHSKQLKVADFQLSDRLGVERKTTKDFLQSIIDGRLFRQAKELVNNFSRPLLVIEGTDLYTARNVHENAIKGALASLSIDFRIPVFFTNDVKDTAELIVSLAGREQSSEKRDARLRGEKKPLETDELQEYIVAGFPSLNATLANRILSKFRTIKDFVNASEDELKEVEGIGKLKAKSIREIVEKEYGK